MYLWGMRESLETVAVLSGVPYVPLDFENYTWRITRPDGKLSDVHDFVAHVPHVTELAQTLRFLEAVKEVLRGATEQVAV